MTPKKPAPPAGSAPYALELDDALLKEAVAAVEQHRPRRSREAAKPAPAPRPVLRQPPAEDQEIEVAIPETAAATPEINDEEPTAEPGLDLGRMAVEWNRLVAELDQTRLERDAARRLAETEGRERARLAQRLKRLMEQVDQLQDQLNRASDERRNSDGEVARMREEARTSLENVNRIKERLRRNEEEQRNYGHAPVVLALLPVLENLQRAASHADANPERVRSGIEMIAGQFRDVLRRVGVERVSAETGVAFQPAIHEAVVYVPLAGVSAGTIAAELQPGYVLNGRLLRPARVSVVAPAREDAPGEELLEMTEDAALASEPRGSAADEDDLSEPESDQP